MKNRKLTFILLLNFVLASCGFHLRGSQDLSSVLPEVQLQGVNNHSELGRALIEALSEAKINVLDESDILLNIKPETFSKRVLSLDVNGLANQYELNYHLGFSVIRKVAKANTDENSQQKIVEIVPMQSITEKREYLFDANLVLVKANEEIQLNNDMRVAAMLQLVRRLKYLMRNALKINKAKITK
ncbi:MAG: LPS assembly lipoprotein LptE [Woeseiaceae bacterium]